MNDRKTASRIARPNVQPGMSGKLLGLTVVFVMLAEILIYVP